MGNADAVDLKFEEFFLSSWAVGDPAMVVDVPAGDQAKAGRPAAPGEAPLHHRRDRGPGRRPGRREGRPRPQGRASRQRGSTLSDGSIASPICAGKEWIILDPGDGNRPPAPAAADTR